MRGLPDIERPEVDISYGKGVDLGGNQIKLEDSDRPIYSSVYISFSNSLFMRLSDTSSKRKSA
jgi:hypothetical protein